MPRWVSFTFFIGVLCIFLYIENLVIYEAITASFSIIYGQQKILLGLLLGLLSSSFVFSTVLGMYYYNFFTRIYYTISAIWSGISVYLFFASVLYGLSVLQFSSFVPMVGIAFILTSLLVSAYGLLHARKIVIKEVNIKLPNTPETWKNKKAVWVSDLHLGQLHGQRFGERVVKKINSLPHDITFIGGDLFDGTAAPDLDELLEPLKKLKAPLGTFFITGNHEEFGHSREFINAVRNAGIKTLIDEKIEIEGMQIIGADYSNCSNKERFKNTLEKLEIDSNKPSILLKHEPKDLDVSRDAKISLQISGHTHRAQIWPLEYIAKFVYKGFSYGLKPLGNLQVYVSSGTGTWGPPMRVGTNSEIILFSFS
jgi:predicted MPP superfamily phosphohydrolase